VSNYSLLIKLLILLHIEYNINRIGGK